MPGDRYDTYQQYAAHCVELARKMDNPHDRTILLQMARLWSRLAQYAAKHTVPEEPLEPA